jgi:hypothetical protein
VARVLLQRGAREILEGVYAVSLETDSGDGGAKPDGAEDPV